MDSLNTFQTFQSLRQESERDCGVPVFGKLAGVSRQEVLRDLPQAVNGITVSQWEDWLRGKDLEVTRYSENEAYTLPCAHLMARAPENFHWIYQDDSGVLDPDPAFQFMPPNHPKMLDLSCYAARVLTISVKPRRNGVPP
jgi:hypothetical protein